MTVSSHTADAQPLNLAVCGAGRWGLTLMRNIHALSDVNLAAVISTRTDIPAEITQGAPVFGDWRDAASRTKLDGVLLALPPDRQPDIAERIIGYGLPVFLEKPLALDVGAAARLARAAGNSGFVGLVDHIHLFTPEFQELLNQLRSQGAARAITAVSGNRGPGRASWPVCWDWAPHDIAMALTVMGEMPVSVRARIVDRKAEGTAVYENVRLTLTFPDGGIAEITTGNAFENRVRHFTAALDGYSIEYSENASDERSLVVWHGNEKQKIGVASVPPLTAALTEFAARIRQGTGGADDLALGVEVVRVLSAAERSIAQGIAVSIESSASHATRVSTGC